MTNFLSQVWDQPTEMPELQLLPFLIIKVLLSR